MRVLGVTQQDLEKKELADYNGMEARFELFENKRRMLIGQVGDMATRSPGEHGNADEGVHVNRNSAFMEKVLEVERINMERMAVRAKKDVQKIVVEELETKLILHNASKKMEASDLRLKALKKERNDKLLAIKKDAQKRADKNAEVRARHTRHMEEDAAKMIEKLGEAKTRADNKIAEVEQGWEENRIKGREKQAEIAKRTTRLEQQQLRYRERQYDGIVAKHEAKVMKLEETIAARQSQSEAIMQRHEDSLDRVREHWADKERRTQEKYDQIQQRHEAAKEKREAELAKQAKEFSMRNTKERNGFTNRYERIQKELARAPPSRRLEQMSASGDGPFVRSLSESQISALRMRDHHTDLVSMNRERLRRAHHLAQEQQLEKIDSMRERVGFMLKSKASADHRRTFTLKNCAIEKFHLTNEVDKVKCSPADKMVKLVQEMDPEPEADKRIREIMGQLGLEKLLGPTEAEPEKAQ
uniref:Uncharacterized protein n=1 Tax=Alexandrium catenella TaxID=2925 RepID=A0A7S1PYQ3_ALECA